MAVDVIDECFHEFVAAIDRANDCDETRRKVLEMSKLPGISGTRPIFQLTEMVLGGIEKDPSISDFETWDLNDLAACCLILTHMLATPFGKAGPRLYSALTFIWLPLVSSRLKYEVECHGG